MEEEDVMIEQDGGGWRFVVSKTSLFQQLFNGIKISLGRRVTDIERLEWGDLGLHNWYQVSNWSWWYEFAAECLEILGPVLNEVTEEQPDPEFRVAIILLYSIDLSALCDRSEEFIISGAYLLPHIPLRELDGCI